MKKFTLFLAILFCAYSATAEVPNIRLVIETQVSRSVAIGQTAIWVARSFASPSTVIQLYDSQSGLLIANGSMKVGTLDENFSFSFEAKDKKVRVTLLSLYINTTIPGLARMNITDDTSGYKEDSGPKIQALLDDYKAFLSNYSQDF